MKINISVLPHNIAGYLNVSPSLGYNIIRLDQIDQASCREILADSITDFIPHSAFDNTLKNYISKLRHQGKIIVGGTDFIEVMKVYTLRAIDTKQLNIILYGNQNHAWEFKRNMLSLHELTTKIEECGLVITKKRLEGYTMLVEAIRP